ARDDLRRRRGRRGLDGGAEPPGLAAAPAGLTRARSPCWILPRMTAQGPHTLYVAWGFAPHRGPGVYRPLATVGELVRRGHRVTVLTTDLDTFDLVIGSDRGLLADVDPSVRVVRV